MAMSFRPLRRSGLSVGGVIVLYIAVCITFVIGARLWNVAVDPDSYNKTRPWYSLRIGGFSTYGGITGALIIFLFAAVITRIRLLKILDSVTIPGAVAFSVACVGCFLAGCCAGKETDLPWGVVFSHANDVSVSLIHAVHPTQLYELILTLLGIPLCLFIVKKTHAGEGGRFFIYGVWFCTLRLAVHPLRSFPYSPVVTNIVYPLLYYVLIVLGVFLFVWSCRKDPIGCRQRTGWEAVEQVEGRAEKLHAFLAHGFKQKG